LSIRRVDMPSQAGKGIRCGECLKNFKSWLRLKKHQADFHGAQNEFTKYTTNEMSLTGRKSVQKENLHISEEALKDEISKLRARK